MVCLVPQWFFWVYLHGNVGPPSLKSTTLPVRQPQPCCESSPHRLRVSVPLTGLDEHFFFNSLVVGLPYSLIFWQFWLFFVFRFVVVLLLVVQGGTVCLPMPPSWPEVPTKVFLSCCYSAEPVPALSIHLVERFLLVIIVYSKITSEIKLIGRGPV